MSHYDMPNGSTPAPSDDIPLDSGAYAEAAFAEVARQPFPDDIFTAPRLRWAVIGAAGMAQQMATSLSYAGRTLAGVWNRTHDKAVAFAEKNSIARVYDTLDELLADPDIDAVYITTPHATHSEFLQRVLSSGKQLCARSRLRSILMNALEHWPRLMPMGSSSSTPQPSCICLCIESSFIVLWRMNSAL